MNGREILDQTIVALVSIGVPIEQVSTAAVGVRLGLAIGKDHPNYTEAYLRATAGEVPFDTPPDSKAADSFVELVPIK